VLPEGADAVIAQEDTRRDGDRLVIDPAEAEAIAPGWFVRRRAEEVRAGEVLLAAGHRLAPGDLALLAGAAAERPSVHRRPRVAIVATGDELVPPGQPLGPGQIHDSNALALQALAEAEGAEIVSSMKAPDDHARTLEVLNEAIAQADLLLVSGGVSVGPHDHVKPALGELGVTEVFWRVALRPGKPTWFGTRDGTLVIGLPGNPVSALVTFVLFARPALAALQGAAPPARARVTLGEDIERRPERDEAVRVRLDEDGRAFATGPQGSHVLSSMLSARGLAIVPRGAGSLEAGTPVDMELL
jgi:molybdopterin molybdotransferase